MSYEEFMDMDNVEINEAIDVSQIAGKKIYKNGAEISLIDWIWEDKHKPSVRVIKGR